MGLKDIKVQLSGSVGIGDRVIAPFTAEAQQDAVVVAAANFEWVRDRVRECLLKHYGAATPAPGISRVQTSDLMYEFTNPAPHLSDAVCRVELHLAVRRDGYATADVAMYDHTKGQWRKEDAAEHLPVSNLSHNSTLTQARIVPELFDALIQELHLAGFKNLP